jgi:hypothetical protein
MPHVGDHVIVGSRSPDGGPHPHAGKTGCITEVLTLRQPPRAMIMVDPHVQPQGIIVVSLSCVDHVKFCSHGILIGGSLTCMNCQAEAERLANIGRGGNGKASGES